MTYQNPLKSSAQYVKGVGPKKIHLLNKLNIQTVEDILYYFPRRHEDRSGLLPINKIQAGKPNTVKGEIMTFGGFKTKKRKMFLFEMAVSDKTGIVYCIWFNQPYMRRFFKVGKSVILHGKVQKKGKQLQMIAPEYEIIAEEDEKGIHTGRITPIYSLTEEVYQRGIRSVAKQAVDQFSHYIDDPLPRYIKVKKKLIDFVPALKNLHFPQNFTALENSRRRFIFDEFFFLQVALALKRARLKLKTNGFAHKVKDNLIKSFEEKLPFKLTNSQKKVIGHISSDMAAPRPMCRLLQGEVGSGKTVVACFGLALAVQNGFQAAVMAPTEILAEQHYRTLSNLLEPLNIKIALLTSSLPAKTQKDIRNQIETGKIDIAVGTHSLVQEKIKFKSLSFIIVDEQHKFGVAQREKFIKKGINPDILVMTATPIPRTLALAVYGDLDISVIDELPPGRGSIDTVWVKESKRKEIYSFIRQKVSEGRQVFVIYSLIEESQARDLRDASRMHKRFQEEIFPDLKIELIHGRLSGDIKEKVMQDFRAGKIDVLVSTVIIEVGIDMPNATCMVIEHADRFGLAQLHQLRGRIARSSHPSHCILIADPKTEDAEKRLQAMVETRDGFKISQVDLEIRGPGEFFGIKQHGIPEFKIANLLLDTKILEQAKQEAFELVRTDPDLSRKEHLAIKSRVKDKYGSLDPFGV